MAKYMANEGLDLMHVIGDGMGHKYDDVSLEIVNRTVDEWAHVPKDKYPNKINFVTYTLRYNTMHWLTVDALEEHWSEARVTAEITTQSSIDITSSNVTSLTLKIPHNNSQLNLHGNITIKINNSEFIVPGNNKTISLIRENKSWHLTPARPAKLLRSGDTSSSALTKRHGLQGPIDDAFMDSFIFVTPTGQEQSPELSKSVDEEMEDALLQWWRQFRGEPRVKRDVDLTTNDIQNNHLILWGDPSSNSILNRIQNSLPVHWDADQFSLHGNQHDARTHIPVLIYPNPLNPHRYVVLNTSFTFSEFSGGTNSLQIPKLPDWAVIDLSVPRNQRHPAAVVNAGFFDEHWQFKDH
ncbi:MAG: hypothetical protein O7C75_11875 [Verrucomicrobia bacterium]|nr:hypothetical protein [Verrucomicrobiota bacterium]